MAKKNISSKKYKYLHPPKPLDCMRSMMRDGMSREQAKKHCSSLWKDEESRQDESSTINV